MLTGRICTTCWSRTTTFSIPAAVHVLLSVDKLQENYLQYKYLLNSFHNHDQLGSKPFLTNSGATLLNIVVEIVMYSIIVILAALN